MSIFVEYGAFNASLFRLFQDGNLWGQQFVW